MDVINSLLRAARSGNLKRVLELVEDDLVDINASNNNGLTVLHSACKEGHTRIVEELLARGANVHAKTLKGNQPIHIASLAGHEPVVRVLLDNGTDVNAQSTSGFTSLYMAAQENHESIVRLLLERGADQNISTTDGFTPLAVSLQQNHENIAKILLSHEARGQVRFPGVTTTGRSLLHVAAKKNDCAAAALLLQNNISPDVTSKSNFTSLHVACHYGNEAVGKLLIDNQANVDFQAKQNITPLHVAARWNQLHMVNLLLDHGAKIDAQTKDHLTPLHCAARMGHDACVELLIKRGAPISAKTRSHLLPLHMAAQGNHLKSARILLNEEAPVDDVTIDHLTSLHVASHCGHVKVAKLLLDYKADPNLRAQNGFTSLHIACKKNHLEIVKLLLKYGASLKAVTESGLSCLHIASFMGCVEIVIYLLDHNADIEAQTVRGETPLILATRSNQLEVIDVLLRYGANANACDQNHQNALHLSARLGNAKIAKLLIDRGIDIDAPTKQMYTALHIASKENHENIVALLLEHGANISCATRNHEFFPLHLASKYGNDKIVELLLNYGAPVDARGKNDVTSLMVASHYDHPRVVELLLMFGASPHAIAKNGYTAIHIAAKGNRLDCCNILLQNDADPNVESKAGFCPLHLAAQEGKADMAALLLNNGAHVNCRAKNGITPLHLCAQEDHVNVAQLLVKFAAHLDAQTKNGFTPLHVACHFTRLRMIRFLLANGANVNLQAASGYTSLHQASQQGNSQIVDLLLKYNAKPDALTDNGHSALSIAENLGHVSVIDTLRIVTETVIKTTKTIITEEKFKIVAPETMQETFVSDSEDEADDTPAHQESVRFLTTDVMRSFNNTMAEDNYNTSQSNLAAERQRSQQSNGELASMAVEQQQAQLQGQGASVPPSSGVPRTTRIADEMSQDLQYLSREAPLDGGESTFGGAYSTLGGSQQQQQPVNTTAMSHQTTYSSTMTRTSTPGDDDYEQRQRLETPLENDYERTDFRIDGDDDATQVYDYNQQMHGTGGALAGSYGQTIATNNQQQLEQLAPDNVDLQRPLQQTGFLVSFMVDARGGAMRGCRHSGVRVIIPPNTAQQPMRITCRYLRRERLVHPPPLMEGEACASKIMEVGPAGAKFLGPVLIEVPHFASLRGKEREITILRSDSGEVWREHLADPDEQQAADAIIRSAELAELAEQQHQQDNDDQENQRPGSAIGHSSQRDGADGGGGGGDSTAAQQERRLTRIVTNEFPQYFAIISRIRQEVHAVGPDGSVVDSQVVPKVQAIFTDGALTKRIKIGLQAQSVPDELVMKLFGSLTAISFSPIVTIEPRRRKFHRPIKLKIPLPSGASGAFAAANQRTSAESIAANLRLLCSITGGQSKAIWEDVTYSTPLSIHDKCLVFTTTVSARFWLVHCQRQQRCADAARFAQELWRHLIQVPFMAKFVVFAKRRDISEANVRVFCMTDDKEEKTLEVQEHYTLVARSRDVEVLDGQLLYLEFGGNLIPAHLNGARAVPMQMANVGQYAVQAHRPPGGRPNSGLLVASSSALLNEQLVMAFRAFQENRLAFACRLREVGQEPTGRIAFMEDSLKYLASLNAQQRDFLARRRRRAVCTLGVQLPAMCVHYDNILGTPKRNSYYANARIGDLTLADIAQELNLGPVASSRPAGHLLSSSPDHLQVGEADSLNGLPASVSPGGARRPAWMELAPRLGIPRDEVEFIGEHCAASNGGGISPALLLLMHWFRLSSPEDRDQDLARGLLAIGRDDIAQKLNFPIEPKRISRSTMELLREIEMIPVRSTENLYGTSSELSGYTSRLQQQQQQPQPQPQRAASSSSGGRGGSLRRHTDDYDEEEERELRRTTSLSRRKADDDDDELQARRLSSTQTGNYFSSGLRSSFDHQQDQAEPGTGTGTGMDSARDVPMDGGRQSSYTRTLERTSMVETTTTTSEPLPPASKQQASSKRQRRRRG